MVRKAASEGSSLFCEWAIGSSINSAMRKLEKERLQKEQEEAQRKRDVIRVELTTDDESERDSVRVTYPRSGKKDRGKGAKKAPSGVKQVRFEKEPLKPSLKKKKSRKKRAYESSGSDTLASETESGTGTDTRSVDVSTSGPSDSEPGPTDTSSPRRDKSRKSRRSRSASSGDSEAVYDSTCSDCERDLEKKKKRAKERRSRRKDSSDPESSTGSERARRGKKEERRRRSKERRSTSHKDDPANIYSDSNTSDRGDKRSRRGKESKKHRSRGESPRRDKAHATPKARKSALSSKQKMYPEAMPGPHPRRPNLIRPIRAEVMQVEHTVEGPEDPRPNAFVDERNNVVRVYHGPAYGNPLASLYPRRDHSLRPLPVGVPHPSENPYYHGFRQQPPGGHMPTTLGDPYSSILANAPIHSGPEPGQHGHGGDDLRTGLWGLGSPNANKEKASSWSNNVGPKPSASLGEANPDSRWGFGGSKKGNAKDDWEKKSSNEWDVPGDKGNVGGNDGDWGSKPADNNTDWNAGDTGDSWNKGNDDTADWTTDNQEFNWTNNEDSGNNQSPEKWDTGGQGTWGSTGDNNSWGENANNTENWGPTDNNSWGTPADNASTQSAPNNVGPTGVPPSGQDRRSPPKTRVPGSWDTSPPPAWGDPTAAQSTQNW